MGWEYKVGAAETWSDLGRSLEGWDRDGWEVVSYQFRRWHTVLLKRPRPQPSEAQSQGAPGRE